MNVLSLFDGMSCGLIAFTELGIPVDRYVAYEIDKYAIHTSTHNFPNVEQMGDVFSTDFSVYEGFDILIGGSPCTYWSIAQSADKREKTASGVGWELFSQYVRALKESKPKYFLYENNKSMSKEIRVSITETFGFEPICIDSALVSAQNRQRLYWVGKREPDGTYSKVKVKQPEDRGILLRDILETGIAWQEKSYCIAATEYMGAKTGLYAVPVDAEKNQTVAKAIEEIVAKKGYIPKMFNPYNRAEVTEKAPTLSTGSMVTSSCAVLVVDGVVIKAAAPPMRVNEATKQGYAVIQPGECVDLAMPESKTRRGRAMREKSNCLTTSCEMYEYCGTLDMPIYQVRDGCITIKGKEYPIKLRDGCYIIRKLTVNECKRLQTVPGWYEFPVSNTQAYKMLGNGWTVSVIMHLLSSMLKEEEK